MSDNAKKTPERTEEALLREAAVWFELVQADEPSMESLAQWQRWMAISKEHQQAYRKVEDLWRATGQIAKAPWPSLAEVQADAYDGDTPVAAWNAAVAAAQRPRAYFWSIAAGIAALAAGLTIYVAAFRGPFGGDDTTVFETGASEHRTVALPDGTQVLLGARSTISVSYTDSTRGVVLSGGEAFFKVASDESWPFVVRAGTSTITAVGTAFNVESLQGRVIVTVAEGIVDVSEVAAPAPARDTRALPAAKPRTERLKAGQRMSYDEAGVAVEAVDPEQALTWLDGRLTYLHEPLKYVIADVARYSNRQLIIADRAVEEMLYTGTVLQGQVDDWLTSLSHSFPIEIVQVSDDRVVVRLKEAGAGPDTGAP